MRLYSVGDVARMFGLHRQTVHQHIERGYFDGVTRGGREWVFPEGTRIVKPRYEGKSGALDRYIQECERRGVEPTIPVHDFWKVDESTTDS